MASSRSIDEILNELRKNYHSILLKGVKNATETACKDIYKFSISCLDRYYENYSPSSYDRSDSLWRAIVPYSNVVDGGNVIISTAGVEYDANLLSAYVSSAGLYNGSKKYGTADAEWVIENFLLGIHPATDGSSVPGEAVYMPYYDSYSTHQYTDRYLKLYTHKLSDNVLNYVVTYAM